MTATRAQAIVFDAPRAPSVRARERKPFQAGGLEVEVSFSGTERLMREGTMPPFPGLGYPLLPGYETARAVASSGTCLVAPHQRVVCVRPELGDPQCLNMMLDWKA